jgi:hypothetical protein
MPRASWKGFLRLSLVSCPVYLSPATTRIKAGLGRLTLSRLRVGVRFSSGMGLIWQSEGAIASRHGRQPSARHCAHVELIATSRDCLHQVSADTAEHGAELALTELEKRLCCSACGRRAIDALSRVAGQCPAGLDQAEKPARGQSLAGS